MLNYWLKNLARGGKYKTTKRRKTLRERATGATPKALVWRSRNSRERRTAAQNILVFTEVPGESVIQIYQLPGEQPIILSVKHHDGENGQESEGNTSGCGDNKGNESEEHNDAN